MEYSAYTHRCPCKSEIDPAYQLLALRLKEYSQQQNWELAAREVSYRHLVLIKSFFNSVENLVFSDRWRCRSLPFCCHRRRRSQLVGAPPPTHSDWRTLPTSYNACMHCVASFNFSTRGCTLWSLPKSLLSLGAAFWLSFKWMKCFPNLFVMLYMALLLQLVAQQELGRNSSSCPNQAAGGYPSKYSSQSMPEFLPA